VLTGEVFVGDGVKQPPRPLPRFRQFLDKNFLAFPRIRYPCDAS
jgi:hypothetical protein